MGKTGDPNILLLVDRYGDSCFAIYSTILKQILREQEQKRPRDREEIEKIILPSDKEWRLQKYFMLVELQKQCIEPDGITVDSSSQDVSQEWAPWNIVRNFKNPHAPPPVRIKTSPGPAWNINKVLKAAQLLLKRDVNAVKFIDEQEMRYVYGVIYDVFRYKTILEQAMDDIEFFINFPEFAAYKHVTWLFIMELARRRWLARKRDEVDHAEALIAEYGSPLQEIEKIVWDQRVHLAAAIARIRIKNQVFTLSELLPAHLRDDKSAAYVNKDTVTGWVNTFKTKKVAALVKKLNHMGYSYSSAKQLCAGEYRFDRVCPRFITLRPPDNTNIGQMDLVRDSTIVLQEREFCEGASTLCRALRVNDLRGAVAQTHPSSPRCSAYLAAQLRELATVLKAKSPPLPLTPELGKLVVFGAGDKVESYVGALRALGIEASEVLQTEALVYVVSDQVYCDTPIVAHALEDVVAVLATPPNSYSAVTDPIDLVCGRGGDIEMLEILTETEVNNKAEKRVRSILEEQNRTLMTLLSKPQIQLILYETHSALEAENKEQIQRAVLDANKMAMEKHGLSVKKPRHTPLDTSNTFKVEPVTVMTVKEEQNVGDANKGMAVSDDNDSDSPLPSPTKSPKHDTALTKTNPEDKSSRPQSSKSRPIPETPATEPTTTGDQTDIKVPNCDLFEIHTLPTLGNGLVLQHILERDGCFLGLIQRKEITRLNAKYMVDVAEDRGLFGGNAPPPPSAKTKKKEASSHHSHRKKRRKSFEVERVAAPTFSSMSRSHRRGSAPAGDIWNEDTKTYCPRHVRQQAAATAIVASCTCDSRHKQYSGASAPISPRVNNISCRKPFPVVITDVKLMPQQYWAGD